MLNFLFFYVQNLPKSELRAHVDYVHATFDMSILWGPRGHRIDSPYPLVSPRTFHCIACGPSRYVNYNGFRLVIIDTPLRFFSAFERVV